MSSPGVTLKDIEARCLEYANIEKRCWREKNHPGDHFYDTNTSWVDIESDMEMLTTHPSIVEPETHDESQLRVAMRNWKGPDYELKPVEASPLVQLPPHSDHYQHGSIQPIEYIRANNLSFNEGNAVKYITRYKHKGGKVDLEKAIQYIKYIIEELP